MPLATQKNTGFTIIEVMIALLVFAFGILAVINMQATSIKGNSLAHQINQSAWLTQAKLEELKNTRSIASITNGSETGIDASGAPGGIFSRAWSVSAGVSADSRWVTVATSWTDNAGTHTSTAQSMIRGGGL